MLKNLVSSFFAILSTVIALCIFGFYALVGIHTKKISNILKENINLLVELHPNTSDADIIDVINFLKKQSEIKPESVRLITEEDAFEYMKKEIGEDLLNKLEENPFESIVVFNINYEYVSENSMQMIKSRIEESKQVKTVRYYESAFEYIDSNITRINSILIGLGAILLLFAFSLIYSTIQLGLYNDRFKMRTMELVGASPWQVRKPFVARSVYIALYASIFSVLLLTIVLLLIAYNFNHFGKVIRWGYVLVVYIGIFIFSVGISQFATYMVMNKYLNSKENNFFS